MPLSWLLRQARQRNDMSARAVSQAAGLSPSYVNKIEAGEIEPSLKAFGKLAHVLGLTNTEITFIVRLFR